ncbi:hypothetical protein LshimejAT787_2100260 [Lyophyllum shimeji]|uniref:Uncharacterized protein n=1 Tax=Lyophyllum shimeji TaxID=47721 RepID=A0A9P3UWM6_LYOSH|nr:hypothetical protein LshimejAT787_2100260 [Lyophyllum shimeji]
MKLTLPLAVSLLLITCRAATLITLYYVSTGTQRIPAAAETFKPLAAETLKPLGVGSDGMTTYLDRVVESVYYEVKFSRGFTTFTASDGSVITDEGPGQLLTSTHNTPITRDGTLVADASHYVFHRDPSPTTAILPFLGDKASCDFDGRGGGACVNEFWRAGESTVTTTFSGPAVPYYTLVVQDDGGKINGASPRVVGGWGVAMVGILFGAFQVL